MSEPGFWLWSRFCVFMVNITKFQYAYAVYTVQISLLRDINKNCVDADGPVVIIHAIGSKVRRFRPGQGQWIFSERKNECDFLQKGSKVVGPV